jgi:hypothetical protein
MTLTAAHLYAYAIDAAVWIAVMVAVVCIHHTLREKQEQAALDERQAQAQQAAERRRTYRAMREAFKMEQPENRRMN